MNRTGQPPQRPPSLGPNPALGGPFRGPFPGYGMPPRNVIPGYPAPPNSRAALNIVPQPSPNFMQQRGGQSTFAFPTGLQLQQSQAPSQHTPQTPLPHTPLQPQQPQTQQQQQQSVNPSSNLPPHIAQNNVISNLAPAPSVSPAGEGGLDPNDFPALGSTPANLLNTPSSTNATSYASQAGTGVGATGSGTQTVNGAASQQRELGPDDFPALGGQTQNSQQPQPPSQPTQDADGHPPGINGFQQHRQNLLGSLTGGQQQPGLLNLGQARSAHVGFQTEADKRNYTLKLSQAGLAAAAAAWNSPNANPSTQITGAFPPTSNGTHANHVQSSQQPPVQSQTQTQTQHLVAPPGVPPPTPFSQQQQAPPGTAQQQTPYVGNGTVAGDTALGSAQPTTAVPQTPAQQVLMSPADKWGLLGLLALIKSTDVNTNLLSVGTDLGTMGLDMQTPGLYSTFITPWSDSSAAHSVEPDFHLPACYNVQPPPPGPNKAAAFSDETLFFMFYSSPRDALQEVAAQELWNRNWRFHKELRLWITKETGTSPSQKVPGGEHGTYTCWDPENWEKTRKEMTVAYAELEEKGTPVFAPSTTLQLAQTPSASTPAAQPQQPQQQQPMIGGRVGNFQGMSMAAM